jgi:hypothetical protein
MSWKEIGVVFGLMAAWIAVSRWVLPRCGIETCCCAAKQCPSTDQPVATPEPTGPEKKNATP